MKKTVYKCDSCGSEAEEKSSDDRMKKVHLSISYDSMCLATDSLGEHICKDCARNIAQNCKDVIDSYKEGMPNQ